MTLPSDLPTPSRRSPGSARQQLLAVARQLFITRGIDAVSYGDIAQEVGSTRANIHYHFGNKSELVSEVFALTFAEVKLVLTEIWLSPNQPLMARLDLLFSDAKARFEEFNSAGQERLPWSLSARALLGFSAMEAEVSEGIHAMSEYCEEC